MVVETDVKAEIFKRLDILGEKLGVAANHLWGVLVRQGIATGVADAIIAMILMATSIVVFKIGRKLWDKGAKTEGRDAFDWATGGVLCWVATAVLAFTALFWLYDSVLELVNPEYFALKTILDSLK